jgi:iron complex transport system ATP-binding protein
LDEPTNHLDIHYQLEILELVKNLGVTTVAALHDLNLAAFYCNHLYVLKEGSLIADGPPEIILNPDLIRRVYGVWSEVKIHPITDKLNITFFPEVIGAKMHLIVDNVV